MHQNSSENGKGFLILLNFGWMVNLAMSIFEFLTKFLIFWLPWHPWVCIRSSISNGTGQCNFSEQRDRDFFVVPGQRDNGTSSKSCHGTGRAGTASHNPGQDAGQDNHYFSVKIWSRTGELLIFAVLKCPFSTLEPLFPVFCSFWKVILFRDKGTNSKSCHGTGRAGTASQNLTTGRDRPGQLVKIRDGTRDGTRKYFLSRPEETTGRPVPVCPGTSRGTSRPLETLCGNKRHQKFLIHQFKIGIL